MLQLSPNVNLNLVEVYFSFIRVIHVFRGLNGSFSKSSKTTDGFFYTFECPEITMK